MSCTICCFVFLHILARSLPTGLILITLFFCEMFFVQIVMEQLLNYRYLRKCKKEHYRILFYLKVSKIICRATIYSSYWFCWTKIAISYHVFRN